MKEKISNLVKSKTFKTVFLVVLTFLSMSVFFLKLDIIKNSSLTASGRLSRIIEKISKSINGYNVAYIPMFIAFYYLYSKWYFDGKKVNKVASILSIFFSIIMVFGYSYQKSNSWNLVFGGTIQLCKSIIVGFGYYSMFYITVKKLYEWLDYYKEEKQYNKKISTILNFIFEKHAFIMPFIIILLMWIPFIAFFYPGVVSPDGKDQIFQWYHLDDWTVDTVNLLSEDVYINNHHPVFHTAIVNIFMEIGELLGSYNKGIFLYTITQMLLFACVLSFVFLLMKKINTPYWGRIFSLLICILVSYFPLCAICCLKDTSSGIMMLFYMLLLFEMTIDPDKIKSKKYCFILFTVLLLNILFRNDGVYKVIIPGIIFILFNKKYWKRMSILLVVPFILYQIALNVLYPALKIPNGSIKEMLSVPFQQTARVVFIHGEDAFNDEEKEIIDKVLQYDTLKENYAPQLSDNVKETFRKESTKDDLKNYFKVWFINFFKYPSDYVQATLNNTYGYFYTDRTTSIGYTEQKKSLTRAKKIKFIKKFKRERNVIVGFYKLIYKVPGISMIYSVGFNTLFVLMILGYIVIKKRFKYIAVISPLLITLLINILSPVNGHWRYSLPMIFCLPLTISLMMYLSKIGKIEEN